MMSWSRLLRAIGFGGPTFFPDLGPDMTGAASPRRKGALILTGIVLAAVGTFSLGAVIFIQLSTLKLEVASLKKELAGSTAKLARFEATVGAARSHPNEIKDGADARMLTSAGSIPRAPLVLTHDEVQFILAVIKVPPPPPGAAPKINVGDLLPDTVLAPLPEPITRKVPKLLGAKFAIDRNRAIVVVAPDTNRVEIIINPS
jgi:hypothetical protein